MGSIIKCIFIVPTGLAHKMLRRTRWNDDKSPKCTSIWGYHNASTFLEKEEKIKEYVDREKITDELKADPRWPKQCPCGYVFQHSDEWYIDHKTEYAKHDDPSLVFTLDMASAPVGAMWYSDWYLPSYMGPDGHSLTVRTPGGDWSIDSRASNCTLPNDDVHKCWVRTGEPPNITVGKGGFTCAAGAGSILMSNRYHAFLQNGELREC